MEPNKEAQIEMLNGHCVMSCLASASQENGVTEEDLLKFYITSSNESDDLVQQELKRILHIGVRNGFIVRNDNKYAMQNLDEMYDTDADDCPRSSTPIIELSRCDEEKSEESEVCEEEESEGSEVCDEEKSEESEVCDEEKSDESEVCEEEESGRSVPLLIVSSGEDEECEEEEEEEGILPSVYLDGAEFTISSDDSEIAVTLSPGATSSKRRRSVCEEIKEPPSKRRKSC